MRKEVIIAIIFGLLLAFIITVAVNRASQVFKRQPITDLEKTIKPSTSSGDTTAKAELVLHGPEDGSIQAEKSAIVTGSTDASLPVVLLVNDTEYISNSDEGGNFSFTAELKEGGNILTVYVLRDDGSSLTEKRTVIVGDFSQPAIISPQ